MNSWLCIILLNIEKLIGWRFSNLNGYCALVLCSHLSKEVLSNACPEPLNTELVAIALCQMVCHYKGLVQPFQHWLYEIICAIYYLN